MSSQTIAARLATTGGLLVRSGIEIGRILEAMAGDSDTLTSSIAPRLMLMSRLIRVEPANGTMLLAYSDNKQANAAALAARQFILRCNHRGGQYAFGAASPKHTTDGGEPCMRCTMPTTLVGKQQRRSLERMQLPEQATVRCDLRMGLQIFASRVVDVSIDGICVLVTDPIIPLCAGTRLQEARIRHDMADPRLVDLDVVYVERVTLPNGKLVSRVGCKVLGSREVTEELIRLFIIDLV